MIILLADIFLMYPKILNVKYQYMKQYAFEMKKPMNIQVFKLNNKLNLFINIYSYANIFFGNLDNGKVTFPLHLSLILIKIDK